jgi:TnpA family transposase
MSRQTLLSAEQRTRLFGIPTEASEMAKHYVLSPEDLALIRAKRRSGNRLGFAVQLCLLRIRTKAWASASIRQQQRSPSSRANWTFRRPPFV